ncbi:MAG: 4Fe-4S dicluster domain-containing protein [Eggerthellaceae bacterium]|nr:4Fe-4S dicluster domain-containing protein [Eggerthellaceae bacterium]
MGKAFYFDSALCTGCKTCELACKDYHDLDEGITFRRVFDIEGGSWELPAGGGPAVRQGVYVYHVSLACCHCDFGVCMEVCPTGAMHRDEQGLVWPDHDKCVGCGYCSMACPYGAPSLDLEAKKSSKCDGCTGRVADGGKPVCVEACPVRALEFGLESEVLSAHPDSVRCVPPLPDPSFTGPNLYVGPCPASEMAQEQGGWVANEGEV